MIPVKLSNKNTSKAKQNLISMNKLGLYWFPSINTTDVTPISLFLLNRETLGQEKTVDLSSPIDKYLKSLSPYIHCVKSVRSYSGPYFPAFVLNADQNNSK